MGYVLKHFNEDLIPTLLQVEVGSSMLNSYLTLGTAGNSCDDF